MKTKRVLRPTRRQKILIDSLRLDARNYLVISETADKLELYNKHTGKTITRYKKGDLK